MNVCSQTICDQVTFNMFKLPFDRPWDMATDDQLFCCCVGVIFRQSLSKGIQILSDSRR